MGGGRVETRAQPGAGGGRGHSDRLPIQPKHRPRTVYAAKPHGRRASHQTSEGSWRAKSRHSGTPKHVLRSSASGHRAEHSHKMPCCSYIWGCFACEMVANSPLWSICQLLRVLIAAIRLPPATSRYCELAESDTEVSSMAASAGPCPTWFAVAACTHTSASLFWFGCAPS